MFSKFEFINEHWATAMATTLLTAPVLLVEVWQLQLSAILPEFVSQCNSAVQRHAWL